MEGGDVVVASVVSTLAKLESPPATRNSHKCENTQSHGKMVESALQILHKAPTGLLDRHAEELVDVALHTKLINDCDSKLQRECGRQTLSSDR